MFGVKINFKKHVSSINAFPTGLCSVDKIRNLYLKFILNDRPYLKLCVYKSKEEIRLYLKFYLCLRKLRI